MMLHENRLLEDDSHEILYHAFFIRKLGNISEKLSSAAVLYCHSYFARFRKLQISVTCTPAVVRKMSYSGCDLKLCDFIAKLWSSIHVPVQLPCGGSRLLQRRGTVFAFRLCGPGSIPTSSGWDFSAPCNTKTG